VGAGFGALALPLARTLEQVTALEPAPAMVAALRRAAAEAGLTNVHVVEAAWGEQPLAAHDVVVCAHVGPLLRRGSAFVAGLSRLARRAVVLVHDTAGGDDKFFFSELYPRLLGRTYARSCGDTRAVEAVRALGAHPAVTPIAYRSDQPFCSLGRTCASISAAGCVASPAGGWRRFASALSSSPGASDNTGGSGRPPIPPEAARGTPAEPWRPSKCCD
jgi:hypothetical protein